MTDESTLPPQPPAPPENTLPVDLEQEMKRSYLDYAMSVIVGRALPDVRDGLKPVHRRVLYGMWEAGNLSNRAYKKSARIVGDVMGKYHPHGDSPIYDTLVRMAQEFSMRYPLVDGQGNFGSIDGDNPAAMRYTEVRLTKLAEEMLRDDIDKDTVPWLPNYDGSEREPHPLPAKVPNLLVNGSSGIAVGMATNIPPHNLAEVIAALRLYMDDPAVPLERLMGVLPGPDFPTGGTIHGRAGIRSAYATGRGTIQVRARAEIEDMKGDRQAIVVTEIPYQVNKVRLIERIVELVREKKLEGITDLRDESDRDGIRVVVELRRGEIPEVLLNSLYKLTPMQISFGINVLAIVDNQPQVLSLKELLRHFLEHRKTVVVRRTRFDLRRAEERAHILEGILKALDHLDQVITTIRTSRTPAEAKERLQHELALSEPQAQAILEMRLQRLTGLERDKVVEEYRELSALIERLRAILASDALVLEEIRRELAELALAYGDRRRTEIVDASGDISVEDMIADEDMVITVTNTGYIKRSPVSAYRAQQRGGKGRTGMAPKEDDFVASLYVASAHSYILVFTESGHVHWLKVHQIPELSPASRGKAIVNLLQLGPEEKIATTVAVRSFEPGQYLFFVTEQGTVKKTELTAFANPLVRGIIAIGIDPGDRLLDVRITDGERNLLLATRKGLAIRFPETDVRPMGRPAHGVRGIRLLGGDQVVGMEALRGSGDILTVTERGYGKRTSIDEYREQGRGGKGIINLKVSRKTGEVVGVLEVEPSDDVILISSEGKLIRIAVEGLRTIGRSTQGVKVMDLDGEDMLVAMAKVVERDVEDVDGGEGGLSLAGAELAAGGPAAGEQGDQEQGELGEDESHEDGASAGDEPGDGGDGPIN
ncbi:MAG TPA: DNA gyrase subunit A [Thermoanaerobaculia bacterium]|nr:DNA gyrase subunit A [Thermoanaerobaculia bacterium]